MAYIKPHDAGKAVSGAYQGLPLWCCGKSHGAVCFENPAEWIWKAATLNNWHQAFVFICCLLLCVQNMQRVGLNRMSRVVPVSGTNITLSIRKRSNSAAVLLKMEKSLVNYNFLFVLWLQLTIIKFSAHLQLILRFICSTKCKKNKRRWYLRVFCISAGDLTRAGNWLSKCRLINCMLAHQSPQNRSKDKATAATALKSREENIKGGKYNCAELGKPRFASCSSTAIRHCRLTATDARGVSKV